MDRWTEQLVDKLGLMPEVIKPHVYEVGEVFYNTGPDGVIAEHGTTGNKFTFTWEDNLETFSWVPALMSYETWDTRLGEAVRAVTNVPYVFVAAVSEHMVALDSNVPYLGRSEYLAFVEWTGTVFTIQDGLNGDEHQAGTPNGVAQRLAWIMQTNTRYHVESSEENKGGV